MIKDIIEKNNNTLPNDKEIKALKDDFPSCFNIDGTFDIEKFSEYIKDKVTIKNEGYELKFLGKSYARLLASIDTTTVVIPDESHNNKPENKDSQNIYISGDNLDGLKHLLKSYSSKVKCIYIDPPYNTGSDGFVYNDNFNFTASELALKLSIDEEQAQRVLDLTNRGSSSHSAWLMFMYPRLLLARDLLKKDGVIFISIDRNEFSNLSLICNDIFGEENLITQFIWKKRNGGGNDSYFTAVDHEYILVYAKNASRENHQKWRIPYTEEYLRRYRETDEFGKKYYWDTLARDGLNNPIHVVLKAPDGSKITINSQKSQKTVDEDIRKGWIKIEKGQNGWIVQHRVYKPDGKVQRSIIDDAGTNTDSSQEIEDIFGFNAFDYAKPINLIKRLLELVNINQNDIFVDFFSGSGTSACATIAMANKIPVQYILIQLPENLDDTYKQSTGEKKQKTKRIIDFLDLKSLPHTLDYIGMYRIKQFAKMQKVDNVLGFKHYTLQEPNKTTLDKLLEFIPDEQKSTDLSDIRDEFGTQTILTTWLLRDGYGFNPKVETIDFAGYTTYYSGRHLYLIDYIPENSSENIITAIIEKIENDKSFKVENVILFGYSFLWTTAEALKINLSKLKNTDRNFLINFDIRY